MTQLAGDKWTRAPRRLGAPVTVLLVAAGGMVTITTARPAYDSTVRCVRSWHPDPAGSTVIGRVDPDDPRAYLVAERIAYTVGWQRTGAWSLAGRYPAARVRPATP